MQPEKLQAALTERQREAGLYLVELDDDVLQLKRDDQVLATFSNLAQQSKAYGKKLSGG
jgi:hypothetical protein